MLPSPYAGLEIEIGKCQVLYGDAGILAHLIEVVGGQVYYLQFLFYIRYQVEEIHPASGKSAIVDHLLQVDAQALECLDGLHEVHIAHDFLVIAVLLALIVEHGPELDGRHGLDEPYDGREGVVELDHDGIGLEIGLAGHDARYETLLPHPGNDGAHALYGHIVVVAAMLDVVFLRQVGLPAVRQADFLQYCHESFGLRCFQVHIGGLYQVVERVFHTHAVVAQRLLALGLDECFDTRCQRLLEHILEVDVEMAVHHRRNHHHDHILTVAAQVFFHILSIGHAKVGSSSAGKGLGEGNAFVLILHVAQLGHFE